MRIILTVLMAGHGIAHLPGFLVSWQLVGWPEVRLGLAANAVILLSIVIGARGGWL